MYENNRRLYVTTRVDRNPLVKLYLGSITKLQIVVKRFPSPEAAVQAMVAIAQKVFSFFFGHIYM